MKVLGRVTSINVRKVLWVCDALGIDYEREDWGLPIRDPKVPEFLALNPNGQVPVIVDGDFVLWESNAIMTYLAAGSDLYPDETHARALVDQWLFWQLGELNPAWGYAVQALIRKTPGFDDPAQLATSIARWTDKIRLLDTHLSTVGPFVTGEQFTVADVALVLSIHRFRQALPDREAMPNVEAYFARGATKPAAAPYLTAATP